LQGRATGQQRRALVGVPQRTLHRVDLKDIVSHHERVRVDEEKQGSA